MKYLILLPTIIFFSCFNDADEIVTNTNPFDDDFKYSIVDIIDIAQTNQGNECSAKVRFKINTDGYNQMKKIEAISDQPLFLIAGYNRAFQTFNSNRRIKSIPFTTIDTTNTYEYETFSFWDCEDIICPNFYYEFIEERLGGGSSNDISHYSFIQYLDCIEF